MNSCNYSANQDILPDFFGESSNIQVFSEVPEPQFTVSFHENIVFYESDAAFFSNDPTIAADADDRVYVQGINEIHVFNKEGKLIQTVGREGRGPGEFQVIHNFKVRGDKLYVYDANLSRVSVIETKSFRLQNIINIPTVNGAVGLGEFDLLDKEYLVVGMEQSERTSGSPIIERFRDYYLIDFYGNVQVPSIITTHINDYYEITGERGFSNPPIPFDRTTLFSLSPSGKLYFLWTDHIAMKILNSNGEILAGFYHPFQNAEIQSDAEFPGFYHVLDIISDTRNILGDRLPQTQPAVAHFFVDDDERLWLSTIIDDQEHYEWWVLEETGELITRFEWPRDEPIEVIKNGFMYTRETEEDTGLQQIVRYRVEMENS